MAQTRHRLGTILHAMGLVTPGQVQEALQFQKANECKIGEALVKLGYVSSTQVTEALAKQYDLPFIDLDSIEVPEDVIVSVPPDIMVENTIFPIQRTAQGVVIAMTDPLDLFTIDNLRFILGTDVECVLASKESVLNAISHYTGCGEGAPKTEDDSDKVEDVSFRGIDDDDDELTDDAPVIKLVTKIITEAVKQGVSDIHIEPMADKLRIRYRLDGMCIEQEAPSKKLERHIISRIKIMAGMKMQEKRRPQDGRIMMKLDGKDLDFRVSSLPASHGESVVLRILDKQTGLKSLGELGFHETDYARFKQIIRRPNGIFLVTGPTGSGKTTTLYAALNELNRPDKKIITAEEPVEYNLPGVNQVAVNRDIGLTFALIIRTMLRQSPNIILIGEIRDKETSEAAIQAALTGHLVFSTLHTNDAASAVSRLIDLGIPPFLVSSSILAIMAQRLLRRLCTICRELYNPPETELRGIGLTPDRTEGADFYQAVGCEECRYTGYKGREGIFELMEMNSAIRELTFKKGSTLDIRAQARRDGMTTLQEDALRKTFAGKTSIVEVLRITQREDIE